MIKKDTFWKKEKVCLKVLRKKDNFKVISILENLCSSGNKNSRNLQQCRKFLNSRNLLKEIIINL